MAAILALSAVSCNMEGKCCCMEYTRATTYNMVSEGCNMDDESCNNMQYGRYRLSTICNVGGEGCNNVQFGR